MSTSPDPYTWNRLHPIGSAVEIRLANGTTVATKTKTAAYIWAGLALVEVEGHAGCFTLDALRPLPAQNFLTLWGGVLR